MTMKQELRNNSNNTKYLLKTDNAVALYDKLKTSGLIHYKNNTFSINSMYTLASVIYFILATLKELKEPLNHIKDSIEDLKIDLSELNFDNY